MKKHFEYNYTRKMIDVIGHKYLLDVHLFIYLFQLAIAQHDNKKDKKGGQLSSQ